jgi:hypothetical protein
VPVGFDSEHRSSLLDIADDVSGTDGSEDGGDTFH